MSHLAEVYAKDLGVKIGDPIFYPHFFPITEEKYITIHNDDNIESKNYEYWEEVIIIIKQNFSNLKFVQIGSGKEPKIKNVDKFIKTTSIKQSAFIIEKSLLHLGIDSCPVHIASHLQKPIVAIYGNTYAKTCDPLWGPKSKHVAIEAHRDGKKPCLKLKGKTTDVIKPEEVANKVLKLLGKKEHSRKTFHIGEKYKENFFHIIPDNKYDISSKNIVIRFDLLHKEENTVHLFGKNNVSIVTKNPVGDEILKQENINCINYFSDSFDASFLKRAKEKGVVVRLFCSDEDNLAEERFKFFDYQISLYNEDEKIKLNKSKVDLDNLDFKVKSYTIYMKNSKAYPSLFEANEKNNLDDIFIDLDKLMIYTD